MKITFIQTGGTIDKDYPKTVGSYAFEIGNPAVEKILKKTNPNFDFEIISVLRKDSLDITDNDRKEIFEACNKNNSDRIIITHGTDTMTETAKILSVIKNKVIVLTGASLPEKFSDSDATFNIGTAIGAVNILKGGVYIAMNGRIYEWDKCKKIKEGKFVEI